MQALVTPFSGQRYADREGIGGLIAPPYDVIPPERRETLAATNPDNVVTVTLPTGGEPYRTAAETLNRWRNTGVLIPDPEESVYVMRQTYRVNGATHARTGVICGVSVEPYETGRVRPHEATHANVKEDRLALLRATRTMCESLFFLAPDREGVLESLLSGVVAGAVDVVTELDGVGIELWRVSGDAGREIAGAAGASHLYIADGHHRYETAGAYLAENERATRTLGLVVPQGDPGLIILPTHRLIGGRPITRQELESVVSGNFAVRDLPARGSLEREVRESTRTACGVALRDGTRVVLELRESADLDWFNVAREQTVAGLDVARIDALVVEPLLALAGGNVDYSSSMAGVDSKLGDVAAGIVLEATGVEDVIRVADAGAVMPQKATYFVPKVPSGMVFLTLGD